MPAQQCLGLSFRGGRRKKRKYFFLVKFSGKILPPPLLNVRLLHIVFVNLESELAQSGNKTNHSTFHLAQNFPRGITHFRAVTVQPLALWGWGVGLKFKPFFVLDILLFLVTSVLHQGLFLKKVAEISILNSF